MRPNREPDAAGCLIVCPATCSILLLQRSSGVSHGGTWGIPGGGGETFDKDSAATALRETWEEAQLHPHLLGVVDVQPKKIGQFITYLATLPTEQAPTLNWEHSAYSWCPFDSQRGTWAFPGPLHSFRHGMSGLAATMADPGVVRAVLAACDRATPNPTLYHGSPYTFDMREAKPTIKRFGPGVYFTTSKETAQSYSGQRSKPNDYAKVYACDVNLKNPIELHRVAKPRTWHGSDESWRAQAYENASELNAMLELQERDGGLGLEKFFSGSATTASRIRHLVDMGYDGIVVPMSHPAKFVPPEDAEEFFVVVFDPSGLECRTYLWDAIPNPRPDFISTYYNVTTRQGPLPVIEPERKTRPVRQDAIASLYARFAPSAPEPVALPPAPAPPPRVVEVPRAPEPVVLEAVLEPAPAPEPPPEVIVEPVAVSPVAKPKKPRKSRAKQAAAQVELFTEQAKPNAARARRDRRVARTVTETYEDYAGRMVSEEHQEGAWEHDPAYLTPGHFEEPGVQRASRIAEQARGGASVKALGRGNFGEAFLVSLPEGPVVVKIAAEVDIHGRRWDRAHQRQNFMHESGVANELRDLGVGIVPEVEYVELSDGTPALVREYGEPVKSLRPEEFAEVEQALVALESLGWRVEDQIDLYRRADGSLFVADVGIWHPEAIYEYGGPTYDDTALSGLLQMLARDTMGTSHSIPTLPSMLNDAKQIRRVVEDEERDRNSIFVRMAADHARKAIAARRALGLPVPQSLLEALSDVERNG
jgi:8-oxo-dGTP pyrophosphatase MutT (NUDIX family)